MGGLSERGLCLAGELAGVALALFPFPQQSLGELWAGVDWGEDGAAARRGAGVSKSFVARRLSMNHLLTLQLCLEHGQGAKCSGKMPTALQVDKQVQGGRREQLARVQEAIQPGAPGSNPWPSLGSREDSPWSVTLAITERGAWLVNIWPW